MPKVELSEQNNKNKKLQQHKQQTTTSFQAIQINNSVGASKAGLHII